MFTYLGDYLFYQFSHILGGRKYTDWAKHTLELQKNIPIKNKKLATELEIACQKNGFLTFAEYIQIDQFGANGYHYAHKRNGMTNTPTKWPKPIAELCKKYNLHTLVEFGPGDGRLGALALLEAKKIGHPLFWSGVEINTKLQLEARNMFAKAGLQHSIQQLVTSLSGLRITEKCLFIFSYSLDNIPPDIFINTKSYPAPPEAMLGVTVKNGLLSEVLLDKKIFPKKFDLSGWQLAPYQRLYVSLHALEIFLKTLSLLPEDSQVLIMDEFDMQKPTSATIHLGIPKNLGKYQRDEIDLGSFYKNSGSNLLYFPINLGAFLHFIDSIGLKAIYDTEKNFVKKLNGESVTPDTKSFTHAILINKKSDFKIPRVLPFYPKSS